MEASRIYLLFLHLGTSSVDGCSCLEPCSGVTNDIAFSSAALSSLSVDSLLKSDIEELRLKYHRALELKYVSQVFQSKIKITNEACITCTKYA